MYQAIIYPEPKDRQLKLDAGGDRPFVTFSSYSSYDRQPRTVRRFITRREAEHAAELISRGDPYEIDNFCYSIA